MVAGAANMSTVENRGARPLKRFVQKEVETSTAKLILGGQVSEGDTILLDVENGGLKAMIKPGVEVVDE